MEKSLLKWALGAIYAWDKYLKYKASYHNFDSHNSIK